MFPMKHTRRGLFGLVAAAIAGRRVNRALAGWVKQHNAVDFAFEQNLNRALRASLRFHRDCFALEYPRIGEAIVVRKPARWLKQDGEDRAA